MVDERTETGAEAPAETPAGETPPAAVAAEQRTERAAGDETARPERGERPERPERTERGERPRRRGGRFGGRRKVCAFCVEKVKEIDYKEPQRLRRYLSDRGKIEPRRKTGTCAKHQRRLTLALKRARHLALLPFTAEHVRVTGIFPTRS